MEDVELHNKTVRNTPWVPKTVCLRNKTNISRPKPYMGICKHYNIPPFELKWTNP